MSAVRAVGRHLRSLAGGTRTGREREDGRPEKLAQLSFECLADGWIYKSKETAEAHIRLQHRTTNYEAFLRSKRPG
jgi:hypothetical protein